MTIVNDDSRVVNKLEASLTDDARVVIYDRHMFIVQELSLMEHQWRQKCLMALVPEEAFRFRRSGRKTLGSLRRRREEAR